MGDETVRSSKVVGSLHSWNTQPRWNPLIEVPDFMNLKMGEISLYLSSCCHY